MAHAFRGLNSREDRNPILYGMSRADRLRFVQEWYYLLLELSSEYQCYGRDRRCQETRCASNCGILLPPP